VVGNVKGMVWMKGFLRKAAVTSIVLLLSLSLLCAVAEAYAVAFTYEG
jgi:hypothetical protein